MRRLPTKVLCGADEELGLFYAGFGAIITPGFGVEAAYNGDMVQYNNALGFWVLCKLLVSIDLTDDNLKRSVDRLQHGKLVPFLRGIVYDIY